MTPIDPRWVGAWWINFLIVGSVMMLITVPVLGFPKRLPGNNSHLDMICIRQEFVILVNSDGWFGIIINRKQEAFGRAGGRGVRFGEDRR